LRVPMAQRSDSAGGHSVKWAPNTLEDGMGAEMDALDILEDDGDSGGDSDDTFERQLATHMQLKETSGVSRTDLLNPTLGQKGQHQASRHYSDSGSADPLGSLGGAVASDHASGRSSGSNRRPISAPRSRPQSATAARSSARELSAEQDVVEFREKLQRETSASQRASNVAPRNSSSQHAAEGVDRTNHSTQPSSKHSIRMSSDLPALHSRMPLPIRTHARQDAKPPGTQSQPALPSSGAADMHTGSSHRQGAHRALSPIKASSSQHRPGGSAIAAARGLHSGASRPGSRGGPKGRPASATAALSSHGHLHSDSRRGLPTDDVRHGPNASTAGMSVRARKALHTASSSTAGAGDDFTYGLGQAGMQRALQASLARKNSEGGLGGLQSTSSMRSASGTRRRPRSAAQVAARQTRRDEKRFDATTREMATYAHQQMLLARTQVQQANAWSEHLGLGRRYKLHVTVPAGSSTADWLKAAEKTMQADADTAKAAAFEGGEGGYEEMLAGKEEKAALNTSHRRVAATAGVPVSDAVLSNVLLSTARGGNTLRTAAGEGSHRPKSAAPRSRPSSAASTKAGHAKSWVPPVGGGSSTADTPLPAGVELSSQELRVTLLDDGSVQRDVPLGMFLRGDYSRLQRHIKAVAATGVLPTVTPDSPQSSRPDQRSESKRTTSSRNADPRFTAKTKGGASEGTWGRSAPLEGGVFGSSRGGAEAYKQSAFAQKVRGPASLGSDLSSKRLPTRGARGGDAASTRSATGGGARGAAEAHRSAVQAQLLAILQETATLTFCLGEQVAFLQAQGWATDGSQSMLPNANVRDLVMED